MLNQQTTTSARACITDGHRRDGSGRAGPAGGGGSGRLGQRHGCPSTPAPPPGPETDGVLETQGHGETHQKVPGSHTNDRGGGDGRSADRNHRGSRAGKAPRTARWTRACLTPRPRAQRVPQSDPRDPQCTWFMRHTACHVAPATHGPPPRGPRPSAGIPWQCQPTNQPTPRPTPCPAPPRTAPHSTAPPRTAAHTTPHHTTPPPHHNRPMLQLPQ